MKRLLLASLMATMVTASPVWADTPTVSAQTDTPASHLVKKEASDVLNMAAQGFDAVRDIQIARVAIFQGQPDAAKQLTRDAANLLSDASTDWSKFTKMDAGAKMINDQYIIVNSNFAISENFIASPEKEAAIKKANEKVAKGDPKGAIDTLRLAGMSVLQNQYLMPLKQTREAVSEASKLLDSGKYYEANLVLKGAEDGIIVDSELLDVDR